METFIVIAKSTEQANQLIELFAKIKVEARISIDKVNGNVKAIKLICKYIQN